MAMIAAIGFHTLRTRDQRKRIVLLGQHLGNYQIEKLMETLTEGYLRALGESDPLRRGQIWQLQGTSENQLVEQFNRFVIDFSKVEEAQARVSRIPVALPYADRLFPRATFDVRKVFLVHAQGIHDAVKNQRGLGPKDKAFLLSAELFLMQHTCHWFCRSRNVASARILVRHKTPYAQVLASVAPQTRRAYGDLTGV